VARALLRHLKVRSLILIRSFVGRATNANENAAVGQARGLRGSLDPLLARKSGFYEKSGWHGKPPQAGRHSL